jgi:hypothetical protein
MPLFKETTVFQKRILEKKYCRNSPCEIMVLVTTQKPENQKRAEFQIDGTLCKPVQSIGIIL